MWGSAASVGFSITVIIEHLWSFRMLGGHGEENGDVTLSFSQFSDISPTRCKRDGGDQQWRWLSAAAGHEKENVTMPSQKQVSDSATLQPCLILTAHCFSPAPETRWCSPPLWHTVVRGGVCLLSRGKLKKNKKMGAGDHTKWKMNYENASSGFVPSRVAAEEKLRVQHKGRGETLMWPSATERQEGRPGSWFVFSLGVFLSFSSCLTPCIMSELLQTDRQTDRGPAVMEPTGIHTAGGGGGDDGGFSGCNWL